ncbi:hypothetical protein [Rhodohalobacter sp.]|jgi:hypothetical protein|uniref:hypothetical protein n=1 Tax=Rhodohalobacter sp. TaxID=1974210 RepID=UPI003569470F
MSKKEETDKNANIQTLAKYALESDEVPKIYANGFAQFFNNADVGIILQLNGKPNAVINMSYTLAKTLHDRLGKQIKDLEKDSGHDIMTTEFVDRIKSKRNDE